MRPPCGSLAYSPIWEAATYNFSLCVTLLPSNSHRVAWKLAGAAPNSYLYTGVYTNNFVLTMPPAFDQVGIMGGMALFNTASSSDTINFKHVTVTLSTNLDPP
jgi:hypothetical protein